MGILRIETFGSFPALQKDFEAIDHGHAHAVAQAIAFLSSDVLPWAIARDHALQAEGSKPRRGFET